MASEAITSSGAAVGVHATLNFAQATLRSLICTSTAMPRLQRSMRRGYGIPGRQQSTYPSAAACDDTPVFKEAARPSPGTCVDVTCETSGTEPAAGNVTACSKLRTHRVYVPWARSTGSPAEASSWNDTNTAQCFPAQSSWCADRAVHIGTTHTNRNCRLRSMCS